MRGRKPNTPEQKAAAIIHRREMHKKRYQLNHAKRLEQNRAWRAANPGYNTAAARAARAGTPYTPVVERMTDEDLDDVPDLPVKVRWLSQAEWYDPRATYRGPL